MKNKKLSQELDAIMQEAGVSNGCPKQQGTLLYDCASKVLCTSTDQALSHCTTFDAKLAAYCVSVHAL